MRVTLVLFLPVLSYATNFFQQYSFLRVPVVLHSISSFKKDLLDKASPLVLEGISKCIKEPGPLRNEIITSPDFWIILRTLSTNFQVSTAVFNILEGLTIGSAPPAIMADNYESALGLLNNFASAGSIGSTKEQKQDKRGRKGQQAKQVKPQ
jgi:golgi-specific brefeldin A-resistance guanine nucleotide exchange factor 1